MLLISVGLSDGYLGKFPASKP